MSRNTTSFAPPESMRGHIDVVRLKADAKHLPAILGDIDDSSHRVGQSTFRPPTHASTRSHCVSSQAMRAASPDGT